ncbi:MAG: MCE family protein [Rhodospirillales bacterium]|nr:MCE family protein [Rhodospirillales bacterium]
MRYSKINYLVVGLFVIAMIVAAVGSIAVLTGRTGAVDPYYTVYDNVTGVKFGTQVIYEGFPIGQVETVTPEQKNGRMEFRVDFSIQRGWRIPEDSQIEIAAPSLLSSVALQVHAGVSRTALEPGERVNSRDASSVFGAVSSLADQVALIIESDAKPLIREVTGTFQEIKRFIGQDGRVLAGDVQKLIGDSKSLIADIQRRIPRITSNIETFTEELSSASREVSKIASPQNRKLVEEILAQMEASTHKFDDVLKSMDKVLEDVDRLAVDPKADIETILGESRYVVESLSRHIDSINQNMESAARNMNEFSRQIRANPGLLLGSSPQPDNSR